MDAKRVCSFNKKNANMFFKNDVDIGSVCGSKSPHRIKFVKETKILEDQCHFRPKTSPSKYRTTLKSTLLDVPLSRFDKQLSSVRYKAAPGVTPLDREIAGLSPTAFPKYKGDYREILHHQQLFKQKISDALNVEHSGYRERKVDLETMVSTHGSLTMDTMEEMVQMAETNCRAKHMTPAINSNTGMLEYKEGS